MELQKAEPRVDREAAAEDDRKSSGGDRTGGDTPEFDELGTDCGRKFELKLGVAGTWIVGVFLYDWTA